MSFFDDPSPPDARPHEEPARFGLRAWPQRGVAETRTEVDAAPLLEAAGRAEPIWP